MDPFDKSSHHPPMDSIPTISDDRHQATEAEHRHDDVVLLADLKPGAKSLGRDALARQGARQVPFVRVRSMRGVPRDSDPGSPPLPGPAIDAPEYPDA